MIELQKRYTPKERRLPVKVVNLLSDDAESYLVGLFGRDEYLQICHQAHNMKEYWLVVDEFYSNYWYYSSFDMVLWDFCNYSMFDENDKSTFSYWFAHWCAFQLTALNLKLWKFRFLFHDCEKPWLKLFWPYKKVQKWHREHNRHHLEYGLKHGFNKVDWEALMIDWECSRFSKKQCPLNCREEMENKLSSAKWKPYSLKIRAYLEPLLDKYYM